MPKVVSELGVGDWLHVELNLNQLNSYKHLIIVYLHCVPYKPLISAWCLALQLSMFARGVSFWRMEKELSRG